MRLKKLSVFGYRSIKKEEILLLDGRVTILIGANDHGKSNILDAIRCLNDNNKIETEDKNWDLSKEESVRIEWHFSASQDILAKLDELTIKRKEIADKTAEKELNEKGSALLENNFRQNLDNEIVFIRDDQTNEVKVDSLPIEAPKTIEKDVLQLRPRIELFESPKSNLTDQINLEQLNSPDFEFMQGIFRLAGLWDFRNEIFTQNDRTSRLLSEASETLTQILNDKWKQGGDLIWKFEHTGMNGDQIVIKIKDPAIQSRYTRPSLRSSGFRTYFLLSMLTFARTQNDASNTYFFLFDEPGIYLHPFAQLDLQRSFESIADKTQLVYTTHSLFLVNKNYPERNRVISKTKEGTKIDQKPFSKNWKSVRESLGILLSNNFLIAEKTLLVEGPSDVIYIIDAIKRLKNLGSLDIDVNAFSVVDAGTLKNYIAMAKLMLSEGRGVVALIDGDNGGKAIDKELKEICKLELSSKKLTILALPNNKSSEEIFLDKELIKKAIGIVCKNLIDINVRKLKDGLKIEDAIKGVEIETDRTFGKTIEQVTSGWFEKEEKISKLSIALEYENLRQIDTTTVPDLALAELEKIKKALELRGEKSVETGVFEEV